VPLGNRICIYNRHLKKALISEIETFLAKLWIVFVFIVLMAADAATDGMTILTAILDYFFNRK